MALVQTITCSSCHHEKNVTTGSGQPTPTICDDCRKIQSDAEEAAFLAERATYPVEQRLEWIERWIRRHVKNPPYVPPPKF